MLKLILCALLWFAEQSSQLSTINSCTCAAMDTIDYCPKETIPLIERSLDILPNCLPDSSKMCKDLCVALAKTTREDPEGGNEFCQSINKNISDVHVSVYSKTCDNDFKYTGLTFDSPTCCEDGKRVDCEETSTFPPDYTYS